MTEENVTPEAETPPAEEPTENKMQAMMSTLDELGITNVEQLQNQAKASSESGRLANMVGELREEIAALKSQPVTPPANEYDDSEVDIEAAIRGAVGKEFDAREERIKQKNLARAQEAQAIRSNQHYNVVSKDFEQYMNTAQANARLSNGESPTQIFNDMVNAKYRSLLQEVSTAATEAKGDPNTTAIPHVETGQTPPPRIEPADEKKAKLNKLQENWSGNDEDIEQALNALLPSGSLPMPTR